MRAFTAGNLGLRFALELAALAALAVWGANASSNTPADVALAIAAPVLAVVVWGLWSAPRASRRLHGPALVGLELAVLLVSAAALAAAGHALWALVLVVLAVANGVYLSRVRE